MLKYLKMPQIPYKIGAGRNSSDPALTKSQNVDKVSQIQERNDFWHRWGRNF